MTTDPVRARWAAGEAAFAAWLTLESPSAAGLVASAGFDAVVVDLQHGNATIADLPFLLGAIESTTPAVPFIRASWNHPAELMRALDLGARGVICPMVGSRSEAEAFVAACRYPPAGARSYGPIHAAFGRGHEQTAGAEDAILLFAMIETADGLEHLDGIASTPGLDGLFVGPADLSLGMGLDAFADLTDPALLTALDSIIEAAGEHGLTPGSTPRRRRTPPRWRPVASGSCPVRSTRTCSGAPPEPCSRQPAPPATPGRLSPMKLRSLFLLVAGVMIGLKVAAKLREDDPEVLHGPQRGRSEQRPALRLVSTQVQRLTDAATGKSLDAIRRLRGEIRERLGEDDAAAWN